MSAETNEERQNTEKAEEQQHAPEKEAVEEALPRPRPEELPMVLEALLFAATSPLTSKRLSMLTGGVAKEEIEAALGDMRERYERPTSGLMLMEVAGGFQLATRPETADWVLALHKHRRKNPISPAVMETLAIIAYKQPIVRAEIEAIRGVDCGAVCRSLQDAGLIEVVGTREVPGRPALYGTTETFLKTFGLRDLKELPSLSELKQIMTTKMKGTEEGEEELEPEEDAPSQSEAPVSEEESSEPNS